jgi:hypothetical protein
MQNNATIAPATATPTMAPVLNVAVTVPPAAGACAAAVPLPAPTSVPVEFSPASPSRGVPPAAEAMSSDVTVCAGDADADKEAETGEAEEEAHAADIVSQLGVAL